MLVLSRKTGEKIHIGDNIVVVVNRVNGNRVSIGIDAPNHVKIVRGELRPLVVEFDEIEDSPSIAVSNETFDMTVDQAPRLAR